MITKILFQIIIIFFLTKKVLLLNEFGKGVSQVHSLSITTPLKINGFISNELNHEIITGINTYIDSSKFFIFSDDKIKSINYNNPITSYVVSEYLSTNLYDDLYSISSYYIYLPKLKTTQKTVLFGFCTNSNYLSIYEYITTWERLDNKKLFNYEKFNMKKTKNKCFASIFIGKNDIDEKAYISNAYSRYSNDETDKRKFEVICLDCNKQFESDESNESGES